MYYYYIMSELSLEEFHNSFRSCWKSSYSLAFWNLGTNVLPTNVVPDNVMVTLKHLSQIGFQKRPVFNVHCSILQYSWLLIMDMPIVDVEGHEAQQLANYDMPMIFSDGNRSSQMKCSQVLDSCWKYLTEQVYPNMLIQAKCR